jgi:cardiolipin synthase A/B
VHGWNTENVYHSGDRYFLALLRDIARARRTIDIETYIFCDDDLGRAVISALNEAAVRGVQVRIMVDGVGSSMGSTRYLFSNVLPIVEARIYHPLPWRVFLDRLKTSTGASELMSLFLKINRRNHRKTCVIDKNSAWIGSMNICASHLESRAGDSAWRDTGVHITGKGVTSLSHAFERAWHRAGPIEEIEFFPVPAYERPSRRFIKKVTSRNLLVRLNDTWSMRRRHYVDLLDRIDRAQERIWITNAYFVPHASLLRAIAAAARRGVDVRVLVPNRCDIVFIPWVRRAFYFGLLRAGVRIFEYVPRMLHAKTLIIDDWAMVGSSNLNHRSLHHDLEADVVMSREHSLRCLARQFVRDLNDAFEVTFEFWQTRPLLETGTSRALLLLRNWM